MVFAQAAKTILCGEGIDQAWSSILAQMSEQDDLHDLFKMRRWALRIDDDGTSALFPNPKSSLVVDDDGDNGPQTAF